MTKNEIIMLVGFSFISVIGLGGAVYGRSLYATKQEEANKLQEEVTARKKAEEARDFSIAGTWDPDKFEKVTIKESQAGGPGWRDLEVLWPSNNGGPTPLQGRVFRPGGKDFALSVTGVKMLDEDTGLVFNIHGYGEVREDGLFFKECDVAVISDSPNKKVDKIGIGNQCKGLWAK